MKQCISILISAVFAATLVFGFGCVSGKSVEQSLLESFLEGLPQEETVEPFTPRQGTGWVAKSDDGNHWDLYVPHDKGRKRIASCDYQYMKVRGVEMWTGRYYGMNEALNFHEHVWEDNLENLSGCVDWVNMFFYGHWSF